MAAGKQAPRISDTIMAKIEAMILEGEIPVASRLPPERVLAERFGISRPSLREAIQKLIAKGLLFSRQGGGTYVTASLSDTYIGPLADLLAICPELVDDTLEFRNLLEQQAAALAALRASDEDKAELVKCLDAANHLKHEYEQTPAEMDISFHLAVVKASGNKVLFNTFRWMYQLLKRTAASNLNAALTNEDARNEMDSQHRHIVDAILAGDATAAAKAVSSHYHHIRRCLEEHGDLPPANIPTPLVDPVSK
ncbi:FadR/GntR family transcriptional regulator [Pelagibaculum spongiae]|uniref:Pyruvate dehydrogenase complex repressor n=1 Tax=Pelagibaculum spongiae TaxID=2080658 RepID=A0A2V1GYG0_9GAMM|nr:FCD domain-containing protein [Pelagibaculum spongiae]PVZ67704.1 transcriptional regulator PdhR [Pelagibaculum spongiae]